MIIEFRKDHLYLVKVPNDIRSPIISNWSDGTTTLEFYSETYEMEYDTYEFGVDELKQRKEITLPKQGKYRIFRKIPRRFLSEVKSLIGNTDDKYYLLLKF